VLAHVPAGRKVPNEGARHDPQLARDRTPKHRMDGALCRYGQRDPSHRNSRPRCRPNNWHRHRQFCQRGGICERIVYLPPTVVKPLTTSAFKIYARNLSVASNGFVDGGGDELVATSRLGSRSRNTATKHQRASHASRSSTCQRSRAASARSA
jgi:hypothetical protein